MSILTFILTIVSFIALFVIGAVGIMIFGSWAVCVLKDSKESTHIHPFKHHHPTV